MVNYLLQRAQLHNRYFAMRHGESEANEQSIIVSDPKVGISRYGLTKAGQKQVIKSAKSFKQFQGHQVIIYSSDFARTSETAAIAAAILNSQVTYTDLLRERNFGCLEKGNRSAYLKVWHRDLLNPQHRQFDVESAEQVMERVTKLIMQIEAEYHGQNILLVSHADVLHILQAAFLKRN